MVDSKSKVSRSFGLAVASFVHCIVFAAATGLAQVAWNFFSYASAALAMAYALLGVAALWPHERAQRSLFRVCAWVSLGLLLYVAAKVWFSVQLLAELYGSLGRGLGVAGLAALAVVVLFTLPMALWGFAAVGFFEEPQRRGSGSRGRKLGLGALVALLFFTVSAGGRARVDLEPRGEANAISEALFREALERHPEWLHKQRGVDPKATLPITDGYAECTEAMAAGQAFAMVYSAPDSALLAPPAPPAPPAPSSSRIDCFTAPDAETLADKIAQKDLRAPLRVEWVYAWGPLEVEDLPKLASSFLLRPGVDGVCAAGRCLSAWQLVTRDAYAVFQPVSSIPDLKMGVSPSLLRKWLGDAAPFRDTLQGLQRTQSRTFVWDVSGQFREFLRQRPAHKKLDRRQVDIAQKAAQRYILQSQLPGGDFLYMRHAYRGNVAYGESLPRQAGTTTALCTLGEDRDDLRLAILKSLRWLAAREKVVDFVPHEPDDSDDSDDLKAEANQGTISVLAPGAPAPWTAMGNTALPLIAFAECRDRLPDGEKKHFDGLMLRLARALMQAQRSDGSFVPAFPLAKGLGPWAGDREGLFAAGQAIYALSLMEKLQRSENLPGGPSAEALSAHVQRGMDYYAGPYWDFFLGDFFFLEENWHCLAAAASLEHHRDERYERFCLDYTKYRSRLTLGPNSRVDPEFWGGHGFGNVIPPQSTPSAGQAETLSAAIAIADARNEDATAMREELRLVMGFLLRQQIDAAVCVHCTPPGAPLGAWTESMVSPWIRIDYVQHAWAGLGQGARVLELK